METEFLLEHNWPSFGQGNHSVASKILHEWCGKISSLVLSLSKRVTQLETKEKENITEIIKLTTDLTAAKKTIIPPSIGNDWVQVVKSGGGKPKQPAAQLVVVNASINELKDRERRKKNFIVYGVPEPSCTVTVDKRSADEKFIKDILCSIGKSETKPVHTKRLKSKDQAKPGPILVELTDASLRNPVLLAAKSLRNSSAYKSVYISPDLTEAERQLDYQLRQERNKLNTELGNNSPFRYGIRGNQLQKFKKIQYFNLAKTTENTPPQ